MVCRFTFNRCVYLVNLTGIDIVENIMNFVKRKFVFVAILKVAAI